MIINELKVTNLFCGLDDFVTALDKKMAAHLTRPSNPRSVNRTEVGISEMMCMEILYQHSSYKCFQYYYQQEVEKGYLNSSFPVHPATEDLCS